MHQRFIASFAAALLDLSASADATPATPKNSSQQLLHEAVRELESLLMPAKAPEDAGVRASPSRDQLTLEFESAFAAEPGLETRAATTLIRLLGSSLPTAKPGELKDAARTAVIVRASFKEPSETVHLHRELVVRQDGVDYPLEIAEISEVVVIPAAESSMRETRKKSKKTPYAGPRRSDDP